MRRTPPAVATVLVGVALALVLAVGYFVVVLRVGPTEGDPGSTPFPAPPTGGWAPPSQTPPPDTPRPGRAYPVRNLGTLTRQSTRVSGTGNADLHYRRLASNSTAVRFTCTGCDLTTWVVETSRPWPLSGGPLPHPDDYTYVADTVDLRPANGLLVKAPAKARWTLTLTPFDALPIATSTVSGRRTAVVRVRTVGDSTFTCDGARFAKTFARNAGADEYDSITVLEDDTGGTATLSAPEHTDLLVTVLDCDGSWTLTPG